MWTAHHPAAVRVDPDANRPTLIGSTWTRKTPDADDPWNGPVRIVGVFDTGNDSGGLELVVQTVAFTGEPTLTADAKSFMAAYVRADESDALENLSARLRELEARAYGS